MSAPFIFRSLPEALRAGFQVHDKTSTGYLVRRKNGSLWEMAIVEVRAA